MRVLLRLKLALFVIGLILFAYGVRADAPAIRWIAILAFLAAFFLRFAPRGKPDSKSSTPEP